MMKKSLLVLCLIVLTGCTARQDEDNVASPSDAANSETNTIRRSLELEEDEQFDTLEYDIVAEQRRRNEYVEDLWERWARTGMIAREDIFGELNTQETVRGFLTAFHPVEKHIILENEDRHECNDLYLLGMLGPEDDIEDAYTYCFDLENEEDSGSDEDPVADILKTLDEWEKVQDDIADVTDEICSKHKASESC